MRENPSHIPKDAKKVFEGVIFDVYQWEQQLYDGSTEVFEKLARPDTCLAIPVVGNKILIEAQSQPGESEIYTLPGGRRDKGEAPLEAAQRELLEETGYTAKHWELLLSERPYTKIDWDVYVYIARGCQITSAPNLDPGERIETRLVSFDELLEVAEKPNFRARGQIQIHLLKAKYNTLEKEKLKQAIFGPQ